MRSQNTLMASTLSFFQPKTSLQSSATGLFSCPNFDGGAISGNLAEARKCRPYTDFKNGVGNVLLIPLEVQENLGFLELKPHFLVTFHHQKMSLADSQ